MNKNLKWKGINKKKISHPLYQDEKSKTLGFYLEDKFAKISKEKCGGADVN